MFDGARSSPRTPLTSQGSPYSVFKHALLRGDLAAVRAAPADLPRVPLDDAFLICLLILDQRPNQYERAAVRWLSRLLAERRHVALRHAELAAGHLAALADPALARSGAAGLGTLAGDLGLPQLAVHLKPRMLR